MSDGLIYGIICVTFVATTFWLSAVFEGRQREREQKIQQILEEASDPRAVVRVLASVRVQASWFMKMLLWVLLIMLALILYATIQLRISGVPLDTGDWVSAGLLLLVLCGVCGCVGSRTGKSCPRNSCGSRTGDGNLHCTTGRLTLFISPY